MPEDSLSGLDESAIDAEDLDALHASFRFAAIQSGLEARIRVMSTERMQTQVAESFSSVALGISPPAAQRRGLLGLKAASPWQQLKIPVSRLRVQSDVELAREEPVARPRHFADELPRELAAEMFRQVYEQCDDCDEERELEVVGVYHDIPPECAASIVLEEGLHHARFTPSASGNGRYTAGYSLVALRTESGKLRRLLLRLG
ncbi:hypothetical protein KDL44_08060 [bacterium]|nr:hypothetical protein [bacterium]